MSELKTIYIEASPLAHERMSGVGHSLKGLISGLLEVKEQNRRLVLVVPKGSTKTVASNLPFDGYEVFELPIRMRVLYALAKLRMLPKLDKLIGKGVYIFGNYRCWPVTKESYSMTYIHDMCFALFPEFVAPKNRKMLFRNVPHYIKNSNLIITVSETSRKEILNYYKLPSERVVVVPNAADYIFSNPAIASFHKEELSNLGIDRKFLLYVGNIEPRKNLVTLVKAYSQLSTELKNEFQLVLVGGGGWLREEIDKEIEKVNSNASNVVIPNRYIQDAELARLYKSATAFCFVPMHEGFGMPPLEAMSSGCPVILSDVPVLHEVCADSALYVDPKSPQLLQEAITDVLTNETLARELSAKGVLRAKAYDWRSSATIVVGIIGEIE